jgi:hypothetical protein
VKVSSLFQRGELRGFIDQRFAEVRKFGLEFTPRSYRGFQKLHWGTSNIQHRTLNIE